MVNLFESCPLEKNGPVISIQLRFALCSTCRESKVLASGTCQKMKKARMKDVMLYFSVLVLAENNHPRTERPALALSHISAVVLPAQVGARVRAQTASKQARKDAGIRNVLR
jgi:hypothetical protein